MSVRNESLPEEPAQSITLPRFPEIYVTAFTLRDIGDRGGPRISVHYAGWIRDLVAAGLMTRAMARPTRKHWRDKDGDAIRFNRGWGSRNRHAQRRATIRREKALSAIDALPGAREAAAVYARWSAWDKARRPHMHGDGPQPAEPAVAPRPPLRLVVDNTVDANMRGTATAQPPRLVIKPRMPYRVLPDPAAPVLSQRIAAVRGILDGARDEVLAILQELDKHASLSLQLSEVSDDLAKTIDYVTPDPVADGYCCPIYALERGFIL